MSFDEDNRPGRGAYTPPTDDDLPFRSNSFDPRSGRGGRDVGRGGGPPVTLIVSAVVLVLLIVAVVVFYRSGVRSSTDAPPAVGTPVGEMKVAAPIEAQPVDPAAGVRVYRDETQPTDAPITFTPPPEQPQPRPAAPPTAAPTGSALPPVAAPAPARPAPTEPAATPAPATEAPAAATGSSSVQIGAFSSTAIADREYAAVAGHFGQYASGAQKRVTEVTSANGSTLYRTAFSGLSRERAVAFCNALKAAGRDCIVR